MKFIGYNVSLANKLMTFLEESKKPDNYYQKKINALKGFYECMEHYKAQMEAGEESKNPTRQVERTQKIEKLQKALDLLAKEKEVLESIVKGLESYVVDGSVKRNEEASAKFPMLVRNGWVRCSIL